MTEKSAESGLSIGPPTTIDGEGPNPIRDIIKRDWFVGIWTHKALEEWRAMVPTMGTAEYPTIEPIMDQEPNDIDEPIPFDGYKLFIPTKGYVRHRIEVSSARTETTPKKAKKFSRKSKSPISKAKALKREIVNVRRMAFMDKHGREGVLKLIGRISS